MACSFCRSCNIIDKKHTRSTCQLRKAKLKEWIDENKVWAIAIKKQMIESGLGIGSIVNTTDAFGNEKFFVLESIYFDSLTKDMANYCLRICPVEYYGTSESYWYSQYMGFHPGMKNLGVVISSPINPEIVSRQFPPDWETGLWGVPTNLKDTVRRSRKNSD